MPLQIQRIVLGVSCVASVLFLTQAPFLFGLNSEGWNDENFKEDVSLNDVLDVLKTIDEPEVEIEVESSDEDLKVFHSIEEDEYSVIFDSDPFSLSSFSETNSSCGSDNIFWQKECLSKDCMTYYASIEDINNFESCSFIVTNISLSKKFNFRMETLPRTLGLFDKNYCLLYSCNSLHGTAKKDCLVMNGYHAKITLDHEKCFNYSSIDRLRHFNLQHYKSTNTNYIFNLEPLNLLMPTPYSRFTDPPQLKLLQNRKDHPIWVTGYSGMLKSIRTNEIYQSDAASYSRGFDDRIPDISGIPRPRQRKGPKAIDFSSCFVEDVLHCDRCDPDVVKYKDVPIPCYETVIVMSQPMGYAIYHFLVENLPRISPLLESKYMEGIYDPNVKFHVSANKSIIINALKQLVGINTDQIIVQDAIAKNVIAFNPGVDHEPLSSAADIQLFKDFVIRKLDLDMLKSNVTPKIMIIKRKTTRLDNFSPNLYDKLQTELAVRFPLAQVETYDDANSTLMGSLSEQIRRFADSDVVIGAHGAAMSHVMFMKQNSTLVSFKYTSNSDIYQHLSFLSGVNFYGLLWRRNAGQMFDDITSAVGDVVPTPLRVLFVVDGALPYDCIKSAKHSADILDIMVLVDADKVGVYTKFVEGNEIPNVFVYDDFTQKVNKTGLDVQIDLLRRGLFNTSGYSHISFLGQRNIYFGNFSKFVTKRDLLLRDVIVLSDSKHYNDRNMTDDFELDPQRVVLLRTSPHLYAFISNRVNYTNKHNIDYHGDYLEPILSGDYVKFSFSAKFYVSGEKSYIIHHDKQYSTVVKSSTKYSWLEDKINISSYPYASLMSFDPKKMASVYTFLFNSSTSLVRRSNELSEASSSLNVLADKAFLCASLDKDLYYQHFVRFDCEIMKSVFQGILNHVQTIETPFFWDSTPVGWIHMKPQDYFTFT